MCVCVCVCGLIPPRDYQCPVVQQIVYYILRQWQNQTGTKNNNNNNNTAYKHMYITEQITVRQQTDRGGKKEEVEGSCSEKDLHNYMVKHTINRGKQTEMAALSFSLEANVSCWLTGCFTVTTIRIFHGIYVQISAVYLLIVCFLNIGYQTEN